tara:strand:- start:6480 stop:6692 length:213 start_codon:yes stop_codon:yes gene_type:complete
MMVMPPKRGALDQINHIVRWQRLDYRLKKILDRSGLGPTGYLPLVLHNAFGDQAMCCVLVFWCIVTGRPF